ncbi:hypothetical protein TCA2_4531 [Paenibacillus sp. TCA20]|uniref:hypothetical protein n=1 Tax=Paenibacillus sp. TCA20 TaxID=1499968 RepID=UPI0004DACC85|nr:hypothetical protein [Paenibacillus sp. TCA20]GAK42039.1 hypothetical protein TCA2_4531 [Paenibacillus sp. TCA20]
MAHVTKHPTHPKYRMKVGTMPDFSGENDVDGEQPFGVVDGVNKIFVLANNPIKNSYKVFRDGMRLRRGADYDYVVNGKEITFTEPPPKNSTILVDYKLQVATS